MHERTTDSTVLVTRPGGLTHPARQALRRHELPERSISVMPVFAARGRRPALLLVRIADAPAAAKARQDGGGPCVGLYRACKTCAGMQDVRFQLVVDGGAAMRE